MTKTFTRNSEHTFTVRLEIDDFTWSGYPKALWLWCKLVSGAKAIKEFTDYFPDNKLSRKEIEYRFNYLSRYVEAIMSETIAKFFNESALATKFEQGDYDPASAKEIVKRWIDVIPRSAVSRMNIPKKRRGRQPKVDPEIIENADLIYAKEYDIFDRAHDQITKIRKVFGQQPDKWPDGWINSFESILLNSAERMQFAKRFTVSKEFEVADPSVAAVTHAYLADQWGVSTSYVPKLITKAKNQRAGLK